jgi:hypothetical protein
MSELLSIGKITSWNSQTRAASKLKTPRQSKSNPAPFQSKSRRRRSAFFLPSFFLASSRRSLPILMLPVSMHGGEVAWGDALERCVAESGSVHAVPRTQAQHPNSNQKETPQPTEPKPPLTSS